MKPNLQSKTSFAAGDIRKMRNWIENRRLPFSIAVVSRRFRRLDSLQALAVLSGSTRHRPQTALRRRRVRLAKYHFNHSERKKNMTLDSARPNNSLMSDPEIGEMLSHLSAAELKVLLYLTIRKESVTTAVRSADAEKDALPLRKIADGTHLPKKEVRNALRLLSISAGYFHRFH